MIKKPFVTKEKVEEIVKTYPTPFHIYDEKGIRENAKAVKEAFAWNPGFKEYFAVKATPNPFLIKILHEYGCGTDCSSMTELMLSKAMGITGEDVMFSSNDTPFEEYTYAKELGAIINLDDITHIDFCEEACGGNLPETMSCRFNILIRYKVIWYDRYLFLIKYMNNDIFKIKKKFLRTEQLSQRADAVRSGLKRFARSIISHTHPALSISACA